MFISTSTILLLILQATSFTSADEETSLNKSALSEIRSASWIAYPDSYQPQRLNTQRPIGTRSNNKWWCPQSYSIYPCTCDGPQGFILITCDRLANAYSLHEAFKAHFPSQEIGKVSVTNSRIEQLFESDLGDVKIEYLFLKKNTLKTMDFEVLSPSKNSLKRLEIIHNDLDQFPFKNITNFKKLEYLDLHYNSLKSIPDFAFGANNKLKEIDLSYNKLSYIGTCAFEKVYKLEKLDLRYNKLTVLNNGALALSRPNPKLVIDLSNNQMVLISDGAFKNQYPELLNLSCNSLKTFPEVHFKSVLEGQDLAGKGHVEVEGNRFRCTCANIGWLIRLPTSIKRRVRSFYCPDLNRRLEDLNVYDVNCPY